MSNFKVVRNILRFLVSLGITFGAAALGSIFTTPSISTWYATLNKPFFTPPNFIFGPAWTLLYFLMAIAFYLVWNDANSKRKKARRSGVLVFLSQLFFNALWSIVFFGLHFPLGALIIIAILWALILITIKYFTKVNQTAAGLLYPYLAWVSFASLLNFAVVLLN